VAARFNLPASTCLLQPACFNLPASTNAL